MVSRLARGIVWGEVDERTGAYWQTGDVGRSRLLLVLEYMRLVRAEAARTSQRQQRFLEDTVRREAAQFKGRVKRAWPGAQGEGREEEQPRARVQSSSSHDLRYAETFARHGGQVEEEHSAAAAAKAKNG